MRTLILFLIFIAMLGLSWDLEHINATLVRIEAKR